MSNISISNGVNIVTTKTKAIVNGIEYPYPKGIKGLAIWHLYF